MKKLLSILLLVSVYSGSNAQKTNPVPEDFGCCPGKNLVCNGGFEEGQKCVEGEYPYSNGQPFKPGSYTIADYGKASQFCKNWSFNNAPCQRSGKAMFVNGATNGQGTKIIWQQKVLFNGLKQYRFCADVFVLNQCCLNVSPKITMTLTYTSGGQAKTIVLDKATTNDACNWTKYTKGIAQWEASDNNTATISISLDETGIGDGNDFVLDNISFKEIFPIAKSITNSVTLTVGAPTGPNNSYGITGNFIGTLPGGIGFQWIVMEVSNANPPSVVCDINTNPLSWQTTTTIFPGLKNCQVAGSAPGVFEPGKTYKIAFGTFGFCNAWDAVIFTVRVDPATRKATITKDDKVVAETEPVFKKLKVWVELKL